MKNVGACFILSFSYHIRKNKLMYSGALVIFIIGILRLPAKSYDNNAFLIWYAFTAIFVAEFMVNAYNKMKGIKGRQVIAGFMIFLCINAAVLTMAREILSGFRPYSYQLYGKDHVDAAEYIIENTEKDATFLSHNNHNNAIASLTGRNIFCGAGTFLYFHGVGYQERESMLNGFFTNVNTFEQYKDVYGIDYVYVSSYEKSNYKGIILDHLEQNYEKVFAQGEVAIYKVR